MCLCGADQLHSYQHRRLEGVMAKKVRRPQAPKRRNFEARAVRDPQGPFRPKVIKNKVKKKPKYNKIEWDE